MNAIIKCLGSPAHTALVVLLSTWDAGLLFHVCLASVGDPTDRLRLSLGGRPRSSLIPFPAGHKAGIHSITSFKKCFKDSFFFNYFYLSVYVSATFVQVPEEARNGSDPIELELRTLVCCPTWTLGTKPESPANALDPSRLIYPASLSCFLAGDPHGGLPTNSGGH